MFLITTADQRFWKTDENILFLGEWCKPYKSREAWSKLAYEVVQYHWNNREQLYEDYVYLNDVYEQYLLLLVDGLNSLHDVKYSVNYWRIIIGPWLHFFVSMVFDRYVCLKRASDMFEPSSTLIAKTDFGASAPEDMLHFLKCVGDDGYNYILYSEIIRHLELLPYDLTTYKTIYNDDNGKKKRPGDFFRGVAKRLLSFNRLRKPVFTYVMSGLDICDQWKLEVSQGQFPTYFSAPQVPHTKVKPSLRQKLELKGGNDKFEMLLDSLIPSHIPKVHVENYWKIRQIAMSYYPKRTKVIFTVNAYSSNDGFKVWAAEQVEKRAKLVIGQHGGNFGTDLWNWYEEHLINISNKFFTWGWSPLDGSKNQRLTPGRLIKAKGISP